MKPDERNGASGTPARPLVARLSMFTLLGYFGLALIVSAAGLATVPRPPAQIKDVLALGPHQGDCERCHSEHGDGPVVYPNALVGPDDNSLCAGCHSQDWVGGSYPGTSKYSEGSHGASTTVVWPGPTPPPRTEAMASGKCVNCHDPHGYQDASGDIPDLLLAREEALCLSCHDGSPARTNIRLDAQKPFRHPMSDYSDRHTGPTESTPSDYAVTPINRRHAECVDCHNPHLAQADRNSPMPPDLSSTNRGVSRLLVQNGSAGTAPSFTFIPGSDTLTAPVAEYQLCFKCHSSWTTQPSGQTDLARALNPANASYHPVEAMGRDLGIRPTAFEMGWSASSMTACGDCHGSDSGLSRGPHGSSYRYLLNRPYTASPALRAMSSNEICFACHAYAVYGDPNSSEGVRAASRFNKPNAEMGHAEHVGEENVSCYSCHTTHGSADQPHLLVLGRVPGIASFTQTATGGSCQASCHGSENYQVNYAR